MKIWDFLNSFSDLLGLQHIEPQSLFAAIKC